MSFYTWTCLVSGERGHFPVHRGVPGFVLGCSLIPVNLCCMDIIYAWKCFIVQDASEAIKAKVAKSLSRFPTVVQQKAGQRASKVTTPDRIAKQVSPRLIRQLSERMKKKGVTVDIKEIFQDGFYLVFEICVRHVDSFILANGFSGISGFIQWFISGMGHDVQKMIEEDYRKYLIGSGRHSRSACPFFLGYTNAFCFFLFLFKSQDRFLGHFNVNYHPFWLMKWGKRKSSLRRRFILIRRHKMNILKPRKRNRMEQSQDRTGKTTRSDDHFFWGNDWNVVVQVIPVFSNAICQKQWCRGMLTQVFHLLLDVDSSSWSSTKQTHTRKSLVCGRGREGSTLWTIFFERFQSRSWIS